MKEKSNPRLIGYARVSTNVQELALQIDALQKAGCTRKNIFSDKSSGAKATRPGLDACLRELKQGDTLVIWRLDRLGRSLRNLIELVERLRERGIGFKSLCDGGMGLDTSSANGKLFFHIFMALAEFERNLVRERTRAGLEAARARGRLGGRRPIDPNNPKVQTAKVMYKDRKMSVADICTTLGVSRPTFYRYLSL